MSKSREHSAARRDESSRSSSRLTIPRHTSPPVGVSRSTSRSSVPYLPQGPENLLLPDGLIGEQAAELLHEFVQPHHRESEDALVDDPGDMSPSDDDEQAYLDQRHNLPWWKRPSPLWFMFTIPLASIAMSATLSPRVEIYTRLACSALRPEYTIDQGTGTAASVSFAGLLSPMFLSEGDDRNRLCATDPVVQAAVAKLNIAMTTSVGILSCITTAWWGSLSDRYGRLRVFRFGLMGALITDVNFILVARFHNFLPGGYWLLLVGPFFDGLFGGQSAGSAAMHAYLSDVTDAHSRSRVFSAFLGLLFIGIGLGPTIGGLLVKYTGDLLSVFYAAAALHVFFTLLAWFVFPESVTPARMRESRRIHREEAEKAKQAKQATAGWFSLARAKIVFGFLTPLSLFFPAADVPNANPLKAKTSKRDWNLLLIAISYGCALSLMGSYNFKFQYMSAIFGWTSEQIGYWLSVVGFTRALYLAVVLPTAIKYLKPKPPAIQLPVEPSEPLDSPNADILSSPSPFPSSASPSPTPPAPLHSNSPHQPHSLSFDLNLARGSLLVELTAYALFPLVTSGGLFSGLSMLEACAAGFGPALQSVALGLYMERGGTESGRLFGALSVVQAMSSQILGPALFGLTYVKTVATFPAAIFVLAAGALTVAFISLALVRLPKTGMGSGVDVEDALLGEAREASDGADSDSEVPMIVVTAEDVGKKVGVS